MTKLTVLLLLGLALGASAGGSQVATSEAVDTSTKESVYGRELVSQIDWNKSEQIFKWNNAVDEGRCSGTCIKCHALGEGDGSENQARNKIKQVQIAWKKQNMRLYPRAMSDVEVHMSAWQYLGNPYDKFSIWMPTERAQEWNRPAYCLRRLGGQSGWGAGFRPQGVSVQVKRTQKYKNRFLKKCRDQDWGRCSKQCGSGQSIKYVRRSSRLPLTRTLTPTPPRAPTLLC